MNFFAKRRSTTEKHTGHGLHDKSQGGLRMKKVVFLIIPILMFFQFAWAGDDPVEKLKNDTMLYFKPMRGTVTGIDGQTVLMAIDSKDEVRPGMRFRILREGAPFIHPVTKELLGRVESSVGIVEVKDVRPGSFSGLVVEGEARQDDKIRISETKIKVMFCQDKGVDWYLADEYYRKLKATGRIEMIDTGLETGDQTVVLQEAKKLGAEIALLVTAREADKGTMFRQQLFWTSDGSKFLDTEIKVDVAYVKELKFGGEFFTARTGEAILMYDLPFGARFLTTGDFDGDGKQELALSTGKDARVYVPAVDLQFLWEVPGTAQDDHLWMDAIDLNRNGRDELLITAMRNDEVVSYIYELEGMVFKKLWEGKYFLNRIGNGLYAQAYSRSDGYAGDVFEIAWDGDYKTGSRAKIPRGVNLYDFTFIETPGDRNIVFSYDDKGFLNLYDEKGTRTWRSSTETGGFLTKFKKQSPTVMVDKGEWSVKDRLVTRYKEVLVVERVPFLDLAKGVGYKSSRIRNYWWNGFAMEESVLINDVKGSVLDYALAGDKMIVLTSPFFGIKFGNILKGENPLGTVLYIYSIKGR